MDDLRRDNQNLEDNVLNLQHTLVRQILLTRHKFGSLTSIGWNLGSLCIRDLKSPSLKKFDEISDLQEHIAFINTDIAIIELLSYLKCKLLSNTL